MTKPEAIKEKEYSSIRRVQDQYKTLPLVDAAIESFWNSVADCFPMCCSVVCNKTQNEYFPVA